MDRCPGNKKVRRDLCGPVRSIPPHIKLELEGELASFANADVAGSVKLDVTEAEIDWFDLRVVLNVSDTTLTPEEVKLLLNAKGGYVRLQGKGWRRLQYRLNRRGRRTAGAVGLSPRELSAEPQRLHALQLADEAAKKFLPEPPGGADPTSRGGDQDTRRARLPAGVTRRNCGLTSSKGFIFLAYLATNRFGGILADDMGLGKTLQTLPGCFGCGSESGERSPCGKQAAEGRRQQHRQRLWSFAPKA